MVAKERRGKDDRKQKNWPPADSHHYNKLNVDFNNLNNLPSFYLSRVAFSASSIQNSDSSVIRISY